jgi:hypothetical protein
VIDTMSRRALRCAIIFRGGVANTSVPGGSLMTTSSPDAPERFLPMPPRPARALKCWRKRTAVSLVT